MKKVGGFNYLLCFFLTVFLGITFLFPVISTAETKYVSGVILVSIRDSNEKSYKTLDTVETGDQVEVLEKKNRLTKIRTKDNVEGWIPSQYLRDDAPTLKTIANLQKELAELKEKKTAPPASSASTSLPPQQKDVYEKTIDSLKHENDQLRDENQKLQKLLQEKDVAKTGMTQNGKEMENLKEKNLMLKTKLEAITKNSSNIVEITDERDNLKKEIGTLQSDLAKTREQIHNLQTDRMLHWFFAGAGVFFLGFLSCKFSTRKRSKLSF